MSLEIDPGKTLVKLGKFGLIGVFLALIAVNAFSFYLIYQFAVSHIRESNHVMRDLSSAVTELSTIIQAPNRLSLR